MTKRVPARINVRLEQHQPSAHVVAAEVQNFTLRNVDNFVDEHKRANWWAERRWRRGMYYTGRAISRIVIAFFRLPVSAPDALPPLVVSKLQPKKINWPRPTISIPAPKLEWRRGLAGTMAVWMALLVFAPFGLYSAEKNLSEITTEVVSSSTVGAQYFMAGIEMLASNNQAAAADSFTEAHKNFLHSQTVLRTIPAPLHEMAAYTPFTQSLPIMDEWLGLAVDISADTAEILRLNIAAANQGDYMLAMPNEKLADLLPRLNGAIQRLEEMSLWSAPGTYRDDLYNLQNGVLPQLRSLLVDANNIRLISSELLAVNSPKRFLVVYQNNDELRPTGGFMGSFALVDIDNAKVKSVNVPTGGTYDLQGQQTVLWQPPQALSLVAHKWEWQDANWWMDWPTSARNIMYMYEAAGGSSVDGVIAINADVLEKILEKTGPVSLPSYHNVLTADNVIAETQYEVEIGHETKNQKPKQLISDLTPVMMERLIDYATNDKVGASLFMRELLDDKDVQLYFKSPVALNATRAMSWDGGLRSLPAGVDSLAVVHTNIAGQKSDRVIKNEVDYKIYINPDGVATVTATLTRKHEGVKGDLFTGVRNVDYVRLYVPLGSRFVSARGFEEPASSFFQAPAGNVETPETLIAENQAVVDKFSGTKQFDELGYTVFANWIIADPGEAVSAQVVYQLPWRYAMQNQAHNSWWSYLSRQSIVDNYRFSWQHQSGVGEVQFSHELAAGDRIKNITLSAEAEMNAQGWQWQQAIARNFDLIANFEFYDR